MLAGYLPFDDDPANPEGDNINLLYKYIVNTPLTFPEYVTPHARDLLRRILVPNPRKRADLFEVARHSWLSEYAHVVELITSATTTPSEIQNTTITSEDVGDNPVLARSNSVRESSKKATPQPAIGGLTSKHGTIDQEAEQAAHAKAQKDAKRRTVQVEYVAPRSQTQRGEPTQTSSGKSRARSGSQGPVEVRDASSPNDKPLPRDPPVSKTGSRRPPSAHKNSTAPTRPTRENSRTDNPYMTSVAGSSGARPPTGGSMQSTRSQGGRASYGQPLAPEVADTSVHGRIQQPPKGTGKGYGMPSPLQDQGMDYGRPSISVPDKFAQVSGFAGEGQGQPQGRPEVKGHRRSNTLGEISGKIFGRSGSIFGGRSRKKSEQQQTGEKQKRYPPVSMNNAMPHGDEPRPSTETGRSRRSFSQALGRKRSGSVSGSQTSHEKNNRRFSLIPGFSLRAIGIGKDHGPPPVDSQQSLPIHEPPQVDQYGRYINQRVDREQTEASTLEGMYTQLQDPIEYDYRQAQQQRPAPQEYSGRPSGVSAYNTPGAVLNTGSESSFDNTVRRPIGSAPHPQQQQYANQQQAYDNRRVVSTGRGNRGVLQKPKRGFADAWDTDESSKPHDHSGSSGPARKVMDFFRRRGKARGGEDR
jgi:protein-serine/threonine kinase